MVSRERCSICRGKGGRQMYAIDSEAGRYVFDITKASQIARDGRATQVVPRDVVERVVALNDGLDEDHLEHVDPSRPGLMGPRFGGLVLLDGLHRAVRAFRERRDFEVYLLTFEELQSCLLDGPEMTPQTVATEIRGTLRQNDRRTMLEVDVDLQIGTRQATEAAIRACLTAGENNRVHLIMHRKKQ